MSRDAAVAIVAAGNAWPFYRQAAAYVCQPGRRFRDVEHIGFYSQRTIHGAVATIREVHESVTLSQAEAARRSLSIRADDQRLGDVIAAALAAAWGEGELVRVLLLSGIDDPETTHFRPISHAGRSAWTMGQRYTTLNTLLRASTTDDLKDEQA